MDCPTLGAWGRTWIERLRPLARQGILRAATLEAYERVVRLHLGALAAMPLAELRRPALISWARGRIEAGCARRSLTLHVAVLKVCLRDAAAEGLIDQNPAEHLISMLRLPRASTKRRWLESTDAAAALAQAAEGGPCWPAIALLMFTGLRLGEALGLRWEDVDLEERRLMVRRQVTERGQVGEPKSAAGHRLVDLPVVLVEILRHERAGQRERALRDGHEGTPWVLGVGPPGSYAHRHRIRRALAAALERAGLPPITPHGLRHSWLSFRAAAGQNPRLIQEQAGHADPAMTAYYTHLPQSDPAAADEVADRIRPRQGRLFRMGKEKA